MYYVMRCIHYYFSTNMLSRFECFEAQTKRKKETKIMRPKIFYSCLFGNVINFWAII